MAISASVPLNLAGRVVHAARISLDMIVEAVTPTSRVDGAVLVSTFMANGAVGAVAIASGAGEAVLQLICTVGGVVDVVVWLLGWVE